MSETLRVNVPDDIKNMSIEELDQEIERIESEIQANRLEAFSLVHEGKISLADGARRVGMRESYFSEKMSEIYV